MSRDKGRLAILRGSIFYGRVFLIRATLSIEAILEFVVGIKSLLGCGIENTFGRMMAVFY
jgi:hypothetical protein